MASRFPHPRCVLGSQERAGSSTREEKLQRQVRRLEEEAFSWEHERKRLLNYRQELELSVAQVASSLPPSPSALHPPSAPSLSPPPTTSPPLPLLPLTMTSHNDLSFGGWCVAVVRRALGAQVPARRGNSNESRGTGRYRQLAAVSGGTPTCKGRSLVPPYCMLPPGLVTSNQRNLIACFC